MFKLDEIFDNCKVTRKGEFEVFGLIDSNPQKKMLTFLEDEKYIEKLVLNENITCVITTSALCHRILKETNFGIVVMDNPRIDYFKKHNILSTNDDYKRLEFDTNIGDNCFISPIAMISSKNVKIGNNVTIEEFVSIKDNVVIGDNSIIRSGSVIGGEGFEFKRDENETFRIKHLGGVIIDDNVEIQYNCTVDKALYPWDDTKLGKGTKLDNLVHIGHATKIGKNVLLPAGTTISGRVELKNDVWIGVGSVISNGIHFGESSRCNIGSVVTRDVPKSGNVTGNFAIDHQKFISNIKKMR